MKKAIVNPIPKVKDPSELGDYRQISILPVASKVCERVLETQIRTFVENNNLLSEYQSGFRPKHSTTTALLKVVDDISLFWERWYCTILCLLDFKKAFDLVPHVKLVQKLNNFFSFSPRACKLILAYLSNRTQKVKLGNDMSSDKIVTSGTPQGGILSAILFSMFIDDITRVVDIPIYLYADDTQIYFAGPANDPQAIVAKINSNLDSISTWALMMFRLRIHWLRSICEKPWTVRLERPKLAAAHW